MRLREALEILGRNDLSSIASRAGVRLSGTKGDLLSRLARSFGQRGGFRELVLGDRSDQDQWEGLTRAQCSQIIAGFTFSGEEAEWTPTNLSRIKADDARELLLALHDLEEDNPEADFSLVCQDPRWSQFFREVPHEDEGDDCMDGPEESPDDPVWVKELEVVVGPKSPLPAGLERFAKTLRHQSDTHKKLIAWWQAPASQNGLVVLPTGSGKSMVAARFAIAQVLSSGGSVYAFDDHRRLSA